MITQYNFKQEVLKDKHLQDLINQYEHLRGCFQKELNCYDRKIESNPLYNFAKELNGQEIELYHKYRGKVQCKISHKNYYLKFNKVSLSGSIKRHSYLWNYLFKDEECTIPFIEENDCFSETIQVESLKPNVEEIKKQNKEIKEQNELTRKGLFTLLNEVSKYCQENYGKIQWNLNPTPVEMKMKNVYSSNGWGEFNRLGINYSTMLIQKNKAKEFTRSLDLIEN